MSCIQRHTILFLNGGVEGALHVVDGLRNQVQTELSVAKEVVQQTFRQLQLMH